MGLDRIYPSYIQTKDFKYIEIDGRYISCLICTSYPRTIDFLKIPELLSNIKDIGYCYNVEKQDVNKVLKKLNYNIVTKSAEIMSVNKNQIDIDILNNSKDDAKDFRREIQLNNEEVYNIALYITVSSNNKEMLLKELINIENKLYVNNIICKRANFRQLDIYKESLPMIGKDKSKSENESNNILMLSKTFVNFFPFITKTLWDKKGILIGKNTVNNGVAFLDIFDSKYINSNMTILGSSGSGKSYFLKLQIIRNTLKNVSQYIVDLEGEYIDIVKFLRGIVIDFKSQKDEAQSKSINIFDIYYTNIGANFLNEKIEYIISFINKIWKKLSNNEIDIIGKHVLKIYNEKGITSDIESLEIKQTNSINKKYKCNTDMPTLNDLYTSLKNCKNKEEKLLSKEIELIINKYSFIDCYTNKDIWDKINLNTNTNEIILFYLNELSSDESKIAILLLKDILNKVLNNIDERKIIYFDEAWKLINKYSSFEMAEYIFMLFKTVRKKNAAVVIATQDITDFFSFENGSYGKSILNNSCIKLYFKTEYLETEFLINNNILDVEQITKIKRLNKGNCLINIENSSIPLEILSSNYEKKIIERKYKNEKNISST